MPLKSEPMEEPALNLTPMVDIVFLLIIFFMVGTRFAELEYEFEVQLPTVSDAQPLTSLPDEIVINVRDDGKLMVEGQVLSAEALEKRLEEAHERYADQSVLIRGDGQGQYQHVMDVLSICHRVEIKNISLASHLNEEGG